MSFVGKVALYGLSRPPTTLQLLAQENEAELVAEARAAAQNAVRAMPLPIAEHGVWPASEERRLRMYYYYRRGAESLHTPAARVLCTPSLASVESYPYL